MTVDFETFKDLCYTLLGKINATGISYRAVLCPLRGGFYLSDFMSRHLDIPMVYIEISSYAGKERRGFNIGISPNLDHDHFLLCDDIYDSGGTVKKICSMYPGVKFDTACLVSKAGDADIHYGMYVDPGEWVDFFWEII